LDATKRSRCTTPDNIVTHLFMDGPLGSEYGPVPYVKKCYSQLHGAQRPGG